jgi:hypothetical protein
MGRHYAWEGGLQMLHVLQSTRAIEASLIFPSPQATDELDRHLPQEDGFGFLLGKSFQQLRRSGLLGGFMLVNEIDEHVGVNGVHAVRLVCNGVHRN